MHSWTLGTAKQKVKNFQVTLVGVNEQQLGP